MTNIILFQFESNHIRTGELDGNPVFCLSDLLAALNSKTTLGDAKLAISDVFGEGYVINLPLETTTGIQDAVFVFESGLTFLISRSRTEKGKRMNRWIHAEVLPSIRKTGSYSIKPETPQPLPRQLPPQRDYIEHLQAAEQIARLTDPILKSYLLQACYEEIGAAKALPPSEDVLVVAAVKARSLGFTLKPGEDGKLGKWVAKYCNPLGKTQHGRYEVNVYRDDDRLVETISAFFK